MGILDQRRVRAGFANEKYANILGKHRAAIEWIGRAVSENAAVDSKTVPNIVRE